MRIQEVQGMRMTAVELQGFEQYLFESEMSPLTVQKYMRDVKRFAVFCSESLQEKAQLILFKQQLIDRGYAARSINSMLSAINRYLAFAGRPDWKLKFLRIQRAAFVDARKVLLKADYERLIKTAQAKGEDQLAVLLQTICATGIRVSEIRAITMESVKAGQAEIRSKGKVRTILLPKSLCKLLKEYARRRRLISGPIFLSRKGGMLHRCSIWRKMKKLAAEAHVKEEAVFPHNLRHLFARTYYKQYKDMIRLADILGHASVDTTRIYTIKNSTEQLKQIETLHLLI